MVAHRLMLRTSLVATVVVAGITSAAALQAGFPNRTIKIIVPGPPGAVLDVLPRVVAEKLAAKWAQPVVVENRPGGSSLIGTEAVANAPPDGYTLLVSPPGPLVISQYFGPKTHVDPAALTPVTILAKLPPVLVVNPKLPIANLQEFIAFAKENPGKLTYGSPGAGSAPQLAMEKLTRAVGATLVHVPYQGLGPALRDLLAGHIDVMFDVLGNAWPHIGDRTLRLLAVGTDARLAELPDTPTISETVSGYVHREWFAVLAPPNTPADIVVQLSGAFAEAMKQPDVAKRFADFHVIPVGNSPAEATAFIKDENERWRALSASMGVKLD